MTVTFSVPRIHPELMNFVRPSPHSTFSPSSTDRWMGCPFSVKFAADIPSESSAYSEEGTFAHSVCEAVFREAFYMVPFPQSLKDQVLMWEMGDLSKRAGAFDEMLQCADGYVEVISNWLNDKEKIGEVIWFGLEKGIPIFPEEGCFGTGDCIIIGTKGAAIIDYKHGKGKNVSADSLQLKAYAAGVHRYLMDRPEGYLYHAVVYQPRTNPAPKEHSYSMAELELFLSDIWAAIQESKRSDLQPVEGSHCFWCPAKRTKDPKLKCPAIAGKAVALANEAFDKFLSDMNSPVDYVGAPNQVRDEALIKIISLAPLVAQVAKDGLEEFKFRIERGEAVPGVRIVDEFGKRELVGATPEEKAELIVNKYQINPWVEVPATRKLRTISDIEKELGKNKLDPVTTKKITKKVEILNDKARQVLGQLAAFGTMLTNNGEGQEE